MKFLSLDAVALPPQRLEQGREGRHAAGQEFHVTLIAGQGGELGPQVSAGVPQIEGLELAEAQLMEEDVQCHQFRQAQVATAAALPLAGGQEVLFESGLEHAAEVVDQAEEFDQIVHGRSLVTVDCFLETKSYANGAAPTHGYPELTLIITAKCTLTDPFSLLLLFYHLLATQLWHSWPLGEARNISDLDV